ncbi:hypothetical protein [Nitrosopumilus sp.]|uniref:hypothetical protein n=1 Tax=Nitrosopumilus sp. TaxID=2024843 RepID=UPI00247E5374|nr:hypothetical protein [Nitrosopumilus sp.]MCV0409628.1 hypothetical protein [Nitrosopumilus sp.]
MNSSLDCTCHKNKIPSLNSDDVEFFSPVGSCVASGLCIAARAFYHPVFEIIIAVPAIASAVLIN